MKNKLLTLFLALAASVGTLFASSGTCGANLKWTLNNGTLTISGTGAMRDFSHTSDPSSWAPWYISSSTSIKTVIIEDGVTSLGVHAFYQCSNLTSITIPNSVRSIGNSAFSDCSSLTSVHISDVAAWCKIAFGNSYANPLYYAHNLYLNGTLVTDLVIPNSVTSIGDWAFFNCSKISTITVYAEAPPTTGDNTFRNLPVSDITLYVPQQWIPLYKYDPAWKKFNIKGIDATDLKYTVTWKNYDGSILETDENVAAGTIPAYNGATPVKPADEQYTYTFAGWSPSVTTITGETTYIATFSATFKANTYTIHVNQDCTSYMEEQQ